MEITQLIVLAVLTESIWETILTVYQGKKINIKRLGALIIGIILAILTNIDMFILLNIPLKTPIVGCIFTGIIISRGANFVHDIFKKVETKQK